MPATQTRTAQKDALRQLKEDGDRDTIRARYARLLWHATHKGFRLNGETRYDVTDQEAAHILGCKVSTICGRRNELSGGVGAPVEYQDCPVVETSCRRRSRVATSNLIQGGVRVDVLPGGDDEDKDTYPRHFGDQALFSITPIEEETARQLARKSTYDPSPLDRAEKTQLLAGDVMAAKRAVENDGYVVSQTDTVDALGEQLADTLSTLRSAISGAEGELGEEAEVQLKETADDCFRALRDHAHHVLSRLRREEAEARDQQARIDDGYPL